MPRRKRRTSPAAVTYDDACTQVARFVAADTRRAIVRQLAGDGAASPERARAALRHAMRTHTFETQAGRITLRRVVDVLDAHTRRDGLHVLHGWDFAAQRRPPETAPVLLLDYCERLGIAPHRSDAALGVLLEHYGVAVLGLLLVRAWDDGDPNINLDRLDALLQALQGPPASAHPVVDDVGTLLMLAVAYYHPEETAYDALLRKVWALDEPHRLRLALPCAAVMASHLRWGWRFMYRQDVGAMRTDNVVDYPWSLFALVTLMRAYADMRERGVDAAGRATVTEGLLNGLAADPWIFAGKPPAFLEEYRREFEELRESLRRYRSDLLADFGPLQPSSRAYSPLAFACNFLSNASVAMATLACGADTRHPPLAALFTRGAADSAGSGEAAALARELMGYAAGDPQRLGAGGAPLIVYDPYDGVHHYNNVVRALGQDFAAS
jgi:hypothetical protein